MKTIHLTYLTLFNATIMQISVKGDNSGIIINIGANDASTPRFSGSENKIKPFPYS